MSPPLALSAVVRIDRAGLGMVRTVESAAAVAADLVLLLARPHDTRARPMIDGLALRHHARVVEAADGASHGTVRNLGMRAAARDVVLFLDAGDTVDAAVLEALAARLGAGAAVAAAPVRFEGLDRTTHVLPPPEPKALSLLTHPDAVPTAFVVSRRAFEALSGFDEGLGGAADVDFWVRALAVGGVGVTPGAPLVDRALSVHAPDEVERGLVDAVMATGAGVLQEVPDLASVDVARHAHVGAQARVQAGNAIPAGAEQGVHGNVGCEGW